jgi:hypothetical protein
LDGEGFFNLATGGNDYTITENGVYGYALYTPVQYVRARLVSASGGTPVVSTILGTV